MEDLNALPLADLFKRLVAGASLDRLIDLAVQEDVGSGDVTSASIIAPEQRGLAELVARKSGVIAGLELVPLVLERFGAEAAFRPSAADGDAAAARAALGTIEGPLMTILAAERLMLNLVGRLSGIATLARQYVDAIAGTKAVICETRKTTPGLRALEKYAARCGGATLHRLGLYDAALYKDNHLAHLSSSELQAALTDAIRRAREESELRFVEVEVDALDQLGRVLSMEPGLIDYILLDNMPRDLLRQAVRMRDERGPGIQLEASGGINLSNVRAIAETGVDRISVGAITHSAPALDVGLDVRPAE